MDPQKTKFPLNEKGNTLSTNTLKRKGRLNKFKNIHKCNQKKNAHLITFF